MDSIGMAPAAMLPEVTDEDNAWAQPRPRATTRQKVTVALLAAACLSLTSFAVGVRVGKTRAPEAPGTGRFGGLGGFGGGLAPGAATPTASNDTPTTVSSIPPTSTTADPNLGGLLPGLG